MLGRVCLYLFQLLINHINSPQYISTFRVVHNSFSAGETWRYLCLNHDTATGCVQHPPYVCGIIKSNQIKASLTQKKELFSTLNLKFQLKKYGQTEGQSAFLSKFLSKTKQTTEHLLQRQQSRATCPSQWTTYANFPWCSISSLNQESLSAIKGLNPSSHLPPLLSFPHKTQLIS